MLYRMRLETESGDVIASATGTLRAVAYVTRDALAGIAHWDTPVTMSITEDGEDRCVTLVTADVETVTVVTKAKLAKERKA